MSMIDLPQNMLYPYNLITKARGNVGRATFSLSLNYVCAIPLSLKDTNDVSEIGIYWTTGNAGSRFTITICEDDPTKLASIGTELYRQEDFGQASGFNWKPITLDPAITFEAGKIYWVLILSTYRVSSNASVVAGASLLDNSNHPFPRYDSSGVVISTPTFCVPMAYIKDTDGNYPEAWLRYDGIPSFMPFTSSTTMSTTVNATTSTRRGIRVRLPNKVRISAVIAPLELKPSFNLGGGIVEVIDSDGTTVLATADVYTDEITALPRYLKLSTPVLLDANTDYFITFRGVSSGEGLILYSLLLDGVDYISQMPRSNEVRAVYVSGTPTDADSYVDVNTHMPLVSIVIDQIDGGSSGGGEYSFIHGG